MENLKLLEEIIIGRVEPHIYAFTTNNVPNYLKVGDTYRPVSVRLREWRRYFPDLKEEFNDKAIVTNEIFFRDHAVHQYLENELGKKRLSVNEIEDDVYYSMEFFKDTKTIDVKNAIADIRKSYEDGQNKYKYYNADTRLPEIYTYASNEMWKLRPNQAEAVKNFKVAVEKGRKNLLMYAVMRFGKSFTSLCCAKEINAKIVLVVSAKADVKEEWKKTVQSADNFNKEYIFLSSDELNRDNNIVKSTIANKKGVIIFLTLQDLQGDIIKDKHQELFGAEIDLLIVDETHYGARAEKYGEIIKSANYDRDIKDKYIAEDFIEIEDATKQIKMLKVNITLHLSGTPYRILMGSEFTKDDIITFCQFSDIVKAQEEWDIEHILDDNIKEWHNPYYGFPQMIRFAFNLSASALQRLEILKNSGKTYAFSALFKPMSVSKAKDGSHKKFVFEDEVLELFEVIDGSKVDDGLLGFLDYERIKEGKMCRHIVCVLPYCASCDALEELITTNSPKFKNLNEYTIINISGIDKPNEYRSIQAIKNKIKQCEDENKKTITLTVNRMLTGSTVEQWDTMIFFKDTASPQEYDQAIFRLQNQYIKKFFDENNEEIKYNMKPQTLLVDFDPHRMFSMQEQKSLIYNANTDNGGNQKLYERMKEELRISPIITINKNHIQQVEATDILSAISAYSSSRGVLDETRDIPVDLSLLELVDIRKEIELQAELGSKQGLEVEAHKGEETDLNIPDNEEKIEGSAASNNNTDRNMDSDSYKSSELEKLENKFRTYYSRVLFFSFLTKDKVSSLDDILSCIGSIDNLRIADNLNLKKNILELIKQHINVFILNQLDYKIHNINTLSNDITVEPIQRAITAINKFGKLSVSEISTPEKVCSDMVALLPLSCFKSIINENHVILDIASKSGEYAIAICHKCIELGIDISQVKDSILSIPTSSIAYEFNRKIYEVLGLNIDCIASEFTAYDLLEVKEQNGNNIDYKKISTILSQKKAFNTIKLSDKINENEGEKMKFDAIVGNPPYQVSDGGAQASAKPIYHHFVMTARELDPDYLSVIMPTRWYAGGKGLNEFRDVMLNDVHIEELHDYLHPEEIFPDTNNRGGVCYFLWNKNYDNTQGSLVKVVTHEENDKIITVQRPLKTRDLDIFVRYGQAISILDKVFKDENIDILMNHVSPRKPFGIESNIVKKDVYKSSPSKLKDPILCYGKGKKIGYLERESINAHIEWIDIWKVCTPRANNIGTELNDDNLNSFIASPNTICTESYMIIGMNLNLDETKCKNLSNYLKTKFVRFLHSLAKASQDATSKTYRFVPMQDFSEEWTDKKLYAKYGLNEEEITFIENSIKPMK